MTQYINWQYWIYCCIFVEQKIHVWLWYLMPIVTIMKVSMYQKRGYPLKVWVNKTVDDLLVNFLKKNYKNSLLMTFVTEKLNILKLVSIFSRWHWIAWNYYMQVIWKTLFSANEISSQCDIKHIEVVVLKDSVENILSLLRHKRKVGFDKMFLMKKRRNLMKYHV